MRDIILKKLEEIKLKENGFIGIKWKNFKVGCISIKDFNPNGLQDEMLVDYFIEVIKCDILNN